ncbi:15140_t:CDS:10 [Dentiscutata erythropus]|uniref:15140_t:CDS:1 n=1 Tax=Dentiscutata erythropus TaxID=1348616 RepID=A0A9N8YT38_9GLOM|nr:15140_t:CDS:10 [Dentiscutata erythropus]
MSWEKESHGKETPQILGPDANENNDDEIDDEIIDPHLSITSVFYVHLPQTVDTNYHQPAILGSCATLGKWKVPKVLLNRKSQNSTLWVSEPVRIPTDENVFYKYAICRHDSKWYKLNKGKLVIDSFEGYGERSNREMKLLENHYDLWQDNNYMHINIRALKTDFQFVNCIFENIKDIQTLKDRIMEYQYIYRQHKELTNSATNIKFIQNKLLSSAFKEQRLFLCLLLGYYMLQPNKFTQDNIYLPREFPSNNLLEDLVNVESDFSPSDTRHFVAQAIRALVQHNSKYGFTTWFKMFALAPTLDESYAFIDSIEIYDFGNRSAKFFDALENNVKPHIDELFMKNVFNRAVQKLILLSYDLESLLFLWQKIIGFEKTDNHLRNAMKKRIDDIIKHDKPSQLKAHFYIFPKELQLDVAEIFRAKLLKLLKARNFTCKWDNPDIVSFQELLQEVNLIWPIREYLEILESIAESDQILLLESFPDVMKLVLESKATGRTLDQIFESSVKWFERMISFRTPRVTTTNGPKNKGNMAYIVLYYLSQVYPLVSHRQKFSHKLKEQADKIILALSDDVIFPLASCIDEFHEDIVDHFGTLLKKKIEHFVQDPDDRLQQNDKRIHNKDTYQLSFSQFWTEIFLARGQTNELHSHPYVKNVRDHIVNVATSIIESTITIGFLLELFKYSGDKNEYLIKYFNSAIENQPENIDHLKITNKILVDIRQQCQKYTLTFTRLNKFYERFCSSALIIDAREYHEDLRKRDNIKTVTLGESDTRDYWSIHSATIDVMEASYHLAESQTFNNIFQAILKAETRELNVEIVTTEIMQMAIKQYNTICEGYEKWENIKCSEADEFWKHVDPNNIQSEINFMAPNWTRALSNRQLQLLTSSVTYLIDISSYKEKLNNLFTVIENLKIAHNPNLWVITFSNSLSDENLALGNLQKKIGDILKQFKQLKLLEDFWSIIKEMACSKECINFLQELVGHDLKNLINGADDHSDERLIQEDTVSTFIQVKQILEPLLSKNEDTAQLAVDKFIKSLVDIIKTNTSLASKLRLCNAHTQALKNMYKNISNRGEVTKEKIFYAVTKGVYSFMRIENDEYKCTATLSYPSNNMRDGDTKSTKYAFSDLQDLRGRALLIAKAPVDTKMLDENNMVNEITSSHMTEFVIQVDISQQIIHVSSQLVELGHFGYRDFKASTRSTREMEDLLQTLTEHLNEWKMIVNKAQEEHYYLTFFLARHILTFYDYFTIQEDHEEEDHENNKNKCAMLLRLVNDKAELPDITEEDHTIFREYDDYSDILSAIGIKLRDIFIEIPKNRPITANIEQVPSDMVHSGQLFVATCINKLRVPNIIMSLYVNFDKCYPESWQLLICKSSTRAEELFIFTKRCFFAAKNGYKKYLFCIANVEYLEFDLQYRLVTHIRSLCQKENKFNLALICCREKGMHHHILDQFSEHVHVTEGLGAESMRNIYKELCPNVVAVSSDLSGQGKTEWIKERSFENDLIPRSFLVSDGMTFGELVRRLSETEFREFESLHLNIMLIDYPYEVNMFLFELLSLRIARNGINLVCIPSTLVFIEVASTMEQYLLNSLPITGYLTRQHLTWNIDNLIISHSHKSSTQIVARYLDAHDQNVINGMDIDFTEDDEPIPQERCQQLFQNYFFRNRTQDVASYRFLEIFINVLADQFLRMSSSAFFRVELLTQMVNDNNIRKTLLETLMGVSSDFATRSVNSKADQLKNLSEAADAVNANLGTIKHWEDSNHLLVVFLSQTPDSICALYRDRNKVPQNVKNLLSSQQVRTPGIANAFTLDNYDEMSPDRILEKLECLARNTLEERKYPPYALSTDNLLKMALILLRARANVPVVCCGEAGCGKTSLIQFLSIVVNVEFEALNLHAGIKEQDILDFMAKAEETAQERQIWLFFDEINTCNHIGLLANLIAHRKIFGRKIHHNIRLFSACNPYRLRLKSDTQAGLLAKRYEEHSNLVYQVHPLPDQILDYVWDYGVLKPSDEKIYISIMVEKNLKGEGLASKLFTELLFASQEFIRHNEGAHSVSLRDVKRAITLVKYFYKSLIDRPRANRFTGQYPPLIAMVGKEVGIVIRSYILALSLSYQVRIFDQTLRKQYREIICKVFNEFKTAKITRAMTEDLFIRIIKEEQKDYIARMTKPPQTAENDALLENVLVMIICIFTKIPVFIIGAPGASKSLAIRLVSQNLRGADSDDPYFKTLPQIYIIPYQGSSSSTSDGIVKVFKKAQNYQTTSSEEYPLNTVVLLDEVGLAETSPHNPLKVLHSLLEPSYPAEYPNVSVVGISNWRLDNSKSSRALLVQRPKFEEQDLIDTADRLFENNKTWAKRFKFANSAKNTKLEALANSYLEYEKKQPIDNFHGLRDYYSLVKSLGGSEMLKLEFEQSKGLDFERYLLEQISKMMIKKLCAIDINDINDINRIKNQLLIWQRDTTYILSLSSKLPNSYDNPATHKLRIYNDLSKSLELQKLIEIRNLEKDEDNENDEEVLSEQFVDIVFEKLYELQQTEDNLSLQQSFTNRCLNMLPPESPIRLRLYEKIFTQEPLPSLSFPTIHRIFITEYENDNEIFFNLINDPPEVLEGSERLQVIEDTLNKKHPDSEISALCCDVIQTQFFSSQDFSLQDFQELSQHFMKATEYKQVEFAAAKMSSRGDCTHLDALLEDILDPTAENSTNLRISFAGIIIMRLYIIRATREWNNSETLLAQKIETYLDTPQIPEFYKKPLLRFLSNKHALCKLVVDDDNKKIYVSSVIAHIVALHISIPQNSSPLATYMQALQTCQDDFILACPSDELTVIMNAIMDSNPNDKRLTRYRCKCGEMYFVGDCGNVTNPGQCLTCRGEVGGRVYNEAAEGNMRLDGEPLTQQNDANDQRGYIIEEKKNENFYSIRSMSPASYRIIHLFVHAIIGIQAPSEVVSKFIKHNVKENNTNLNKAEDIAPFCAIHINNDWDALKKILACGDEQLALVLHAILSEMTQQPLQQPARLNTPIERETWENQFSQKYILPLTKNVMGTATDFRTYSNYENYEGRSSFALENPKELLSALEIILCFLKRTSGSDRDTLITEYIESWMKLAVLKENNNSYKLLLKAGLQLKHIVALYELVEEHVADVVATCIPQKYQEKLGYSMHHDIDDAVDFESLEQGEQNQNAKSSKNLRIPAKAFATALKRFIIRYLTTSENIIETDELMYYLVEDESLECWPDWVDKTVVKNKFPPSLRISHTFETYQYIKEAIEMEKREHIEENKPNYKKPPTRKQKGKNTKYNRG